MASFMLASAPINCSREFAEPAGSSSLRLRIRRERDSPLATVWGTKKPGKCSLTSFRSRNRVGFPWNLIRTPSFQSPFKIRDTLARSIFRSMERVKASAPRLSISPLSKIRRVCSRTASAITEFCAIL